MGKYFKYQKIFLEKAKFHRRSFGFYDIFYSLGWLYHN